MQESANIDDRHACRSIKEGSGGGDGTSSMVTQQSIGGDSLSDSIELGLPHEPLSITFFKTAFSITGLVGLTVPGTIEEEGEAAAAERGAPVSSLLLDGIAPSRQLSDDKEGSRLDGATRPCVLKSTCSAPLLLRTLAALGGVLRRGMRMHAAHPSACPPHAAR
jgi:hypothetical protein